MLDVVRPRNSMTVQMNIEDMRRGLTACCDVAAAPVNSYPMEGQTLLRSFLADVRTVVVFGHHVQASLEWRWFPFAADPGGSTCAADLHCKAVVEHAARLLEVRGGAVVILPYPNGCGISFKRLAVQTIMGEMGDSFLFLHRTWGPWVHLRVLLTNADIAAAALPNVSVCTHCGKCLAACPGQTLSPGKHDQKACGATQRAVAERLGLKTAYHHKCEICVRACPIGEGPVEAVISDQR